MLKRPSKKCMKLQRKQQKNKEDILMDVAMILLKQLKAKHIISGKVEDSMADITSIKIFK